MEDEKVFEDTGPESSLINKELNHVDLSSSISFSSGSPGRETLKACREILLQATTQLLTDKENDDADLFMYGTNQGDHQFLKELALFLSQEYGDDVKMSNLMVTAGATQGLHLILTLLSDFDCPVFIEDPTYHLAYELILDDLKKRIIPMPCDESGIKTDALDALLTTHKPSVESRPPQRPFWAVVYLIPVSHNPTGITYSADKCKALVSLARKHNVLLVAEDVYNLIYFTDSATAPPRLLSFDQKSDPDYGIGHVLSNASFSKILAPSIRLGWIEGPSQILSFLYGSSLTTSGGSFNHFMAKVMSQVLHTGAQSRHIRWLRQVYKERMMAMCSALDKNLPDGCSYVRPNGGFFLWLKFHEDTDALVFLKFAMKNHQVMFLPGVSFSPTKTSRHCARLSVSEHNVEVITAGVEKLCEAYKAYLKT